MSKRHIIRSVMAVAVIAVIVAAVWLWQLKAEEPITIAAIVSLSAAGHPSEIGIGVRNGMLLAVEEINKWGGINGRKVEVIVEDSESNPDKASAIFQRLERSAHPLAYMSTLSSVSAALAPEAETHNVVLMALVATAQELTSGRQWTFRYWPTAQNETPPAISLAKELGAGTLGVLYLDDEYGRSVFAIAKREWEDTGGTIRGETFQFQEHMFRTQIANLQDMDAILIVGFPGHIVTLLQRLKEQEFSGIILSNNSATLPSSAALSQTEGIYAMAPIIYNPNFLFAKELKNRYDTHYGTLLNHYAANGYDVVKMMASMLEGQDVSREHVKAVLDAGFVYPGVFGDIHVKPGEHDLTFPLYPAQIVNGEVQYLN